MVTVWAPSEMEAQWDRGGTDSKPAWLRSVGGKDLPGVDTYPLHPHPNRGSSLLPILQTSSCTFSYHPGKCLRLLSLTLAGAYLIYLPAESSLLEEKVGRQRVPVALSCCRQNIHHYTLIAWPWLCLPHTTELPDGQCPAEPRLGAG